MSLINQALRKAQHQRTPDRPPTASDHPHTAQPHFNHNQNTKKPGLLIGLVIGIALLIGIVAGLTIVLLSKDTEPTAQLASDQTTTTVSPSPAQVAPKASPHTQPFVQSRFGTTPVQTPALDAKSPDVLNELRSAREATEAKIATEASAAAKAEADALVAEQAAEAQAKEAAAIAAAKPNQEIIEWLSTATVSGVRISSKGNKVILNNKAYTEGETVNAGFDLRVLIIQESRLLFVDANGKKYVKQL